MEKNAIFCTKSAKIGWALDDSTGVLRQLNKHLIQWQFNDMTNAITNHYWANFEVWQLSKTFNDTYLGSGFWRFRSAITLFSNFGWQWSRRSCCLPSKGRVSNVGPGTRVARMTNSTREECPSHVSPCYFFPRFPGIAFPFSIPHFPETLTQIYNMPLAVGDTIPEGTFKYVPYTPELDDGVS